MQRSRLKLLAAFAAAMCIPLACSKDAALVTGPAAVKDVGDAIVVYPDSMHGWAFYNDQTGAACADASVCKFVGGPGSAPAGGGSAELATATSSDGKALIMAGYGGTRFDQI